MSRALLNGLLAALVAALAAWAYLKPAREADSGHALSALKGADVGSIRIERAGNPPIVLERRQDEWRVIAPFVARGNDLRAQQLAEVAQARSLHRYPANDLGRFELDRPQARLVLNGQPFSFGLVNPVTNEQYVLAGDAVYTVSPRLGAALPARADDLLSPRLLARGEEPVRFELGTFTVARGEGGWRQVPAAADPSQDDLVRWVDDWRNATAARVERHPASPALKDSVRIVLGSGSEIVLGVLARAPEVTLVRADEQLKYTFRGAVAKRLLAPPGASSDKK